MLAAPEQRHAGLFDVAAFEPLLLRPENPLRGHLEGIPYSARVGIAGYDAQLARHYALAEPGGLAAASAAARIPFGLATFGLIVDFDRPAQIELHSTEMLLNETVRALVANFGAVVFRNACIAGSARPMFHRNTFSHLRFHVDRGPTAPNQYSCFTRDPDDPAQRHPRSSSTLFIAKIVAWLELRRTGGQEVQAEAAMHASRDLFTDCEAADLFGRVILEQPWAAPEGTGEIAVIDNRTVLHATYIKDGKTKGYPIGARYLI